MSRYPENVVSQRYEPKPTSGRSRTWKAFFRNKSAPLGLLLVGLIVTIAVAAPYIVPYDPLAQSLTDRLTPPEAAHPFGRDDYGRDILSRVMYGTRVALIVGGFSVLLGAVVGSSMGIVAGFVGGRVESGIMRLVDVMLAFPDIVTGILVLAVLGSGLEKMVVAIAIVMAPAFARLAHAPTIAAKNSQFVEAARAVGVGEFRILRAHVVPNVIGGLIVMASLNIASAIRIEAGLSFIGLGAAPPTPTWGQMINDGTTYLAEAPWFSVLPGLGILATVLAFNLLGDGLRDALDPKSNM